jgi:hypothetical protein
MNDFQEHTYETKVGATTFVVTAKYEGTQTFEEVLKTALKRKIDITQSENYSQCRA